MFAVGGQGEEVRLLFTAAKLQALLARGDLPEADRAVIVACGQGHAVPGESERGGSELTAGKRGLPSQRQISEPDAIEVFVAYPGRLLAIGRKGQDGDGVIHLFR